MSWWCWVLDALAKISWPSACISWPRSPSATSVAKRIQCSFQKLSKTATESRITNDLKTTYCKYSVLYGKTRAKYTKERRPLCANTVFSRIFRKSVHFYRVLPCKTRVSKTCKNIWVLPCRSHIWAQKGLPNGPQNGPRSVQNACFTGVLSHRPYKNTGFYRVKWTSDRPRRPCRKRSIWHLKKTHFCTVKPE